MRRAAFLSAVIGLLCLSGCNAGGDIGGAPPSLLARALRLTVAWPERTRAVIAPNSALSVRVTLVGAHPVSGNVSFVVNRNSDVTAHQETYLVGEQARIGRWQVNLEFKALPNGAGDTVGESSYFVEVQPDANGVADITPPGDLPKTPGSGVASVELLPGQSLQVGETRDLAFTVRDAGGASLAVTFGSATFRVESGEDALAFNPNGAAVGRAPGAAQVTVTVDGISSLPVTVAVHRGIVSVEVAANQEVPVGQARELAFTARDAAGNPVNVARSAVVFQAEAGSEDRMTLTREGVATGRAPGTVLVTATVDGVSSPPVAVLVRSNQGDVSVEID